jgi:cytochrome c-type biogenesis protein CcmF
VELGELLLFSAFASVSFNIAFLMQVRLRERTSLKYSFYAIVLAFALITVSYIIFVQSFLGNDFSLIEVYSYSSSNLSTLSKLYASWGGARGSMLFLAFLISSSSFLYQLKTHSKVNSYNVTVSILLNLTLMVFLIVTLIKNPFERFNTIPIEGKGLNPQLQTFWMIIHPPIVFVSYVLTVFIYSLTIASMKTGKDLEKNRLFRICCSNAWVFLTIGIALGGLWAYEV